jgi:hypothetical protein
LSEGKNGFWESRTFLVLFVLASALPLLWPDVPPLVDLPGHMGRYRVQLDIGSDPELARYFSFQWALIGNLGVDLLVVPLSMLVGLETAVKLIVLAIPPLTVTGFLWLSREVHGRVSPTAYFAAPFAYAYPFIFGFVNFALSIALAFLALALWLRLGRLSRLRFRAALFVLVACFVWITHAFGWGVLGLLAFAAETVRQRDDGHSLPRALASAALHCLALALPLVPMLLWRAGDVGGITGDWFNVQAKLDSLFIVLRDRWLWWDALSVAAVVVAIFVAIRSPRMAMSRGLAAGALVLALVFLLLPRNLFGSALADMRLAPYLFAMALLAARPGHWGDIKFVRGLALTAILFAGLRIAGNTVSFALYDREWDRELAALDHVPRDARIVAFTGRPCDEAWKRSRLEHLPGLALARGAGFANDQFRLAGAQLLSVHYSEAGDFASDPTHVVMPDGCRNYDLFTVSEALARLPRPAFDYVWLIDPPAYDPALVRGLQPVWASGTSRLFRVPRGPAQ